MSAADLTLRADLPPDFFRMFTDPSSRAQAELVAAWARARGLRFGTKGNSDLLPAWYIIVETDSEGPQYLLTLQVEREIVNVDGKRQVEGLMDIPFHRMDSIFFKNRDHRARLYRELHALLPQGKAPDESKVDSRWSITYTALATSSNAGAFLAVLDEAVNQLRTNPHD